MPDSLLEKERPAPLAKAPRPQSTTCDPVTLEIVRGAIRAAQAEMEALIERTAISAFIREKKDFYTALFDADGVMAVGSNLPVFGDICGPVFRDFPPDTMRPGDLYWYNDCYGSRGAVSHSNDQVLLAPVFHEGRRCGFVMGWAHFSDIGGLRAGSISPDTHRHLPGRHHRPADQADRRRASPTRRRWRSSSATRASPSRTVGDMRALMASAALGVRRIEEIVGAFRRRRAWPTRCASCWRARATLVRSEARRDVPPTARTASPMRIDSDGHGNGPFHIRLALTRERGPDGDDRFIFDATETDDQSPGPVNLLHEPRRAGHGARPCSISAAIRRRCAMPAARRRSTRCGCARARCCGRDFPAPLGMRGLTLMRFLAAVNGLINVAGGKAPAAHSAYVISFLRGTFRDDKGELKPFLMSDGIGVG